MQKRLSIENSKPILIFLLTIAPNWDIDWSNHWIIQSIHQWILLAGLPVFLP